MTAYVVGYGLKDGLGSDPKTCFYNMLSDKDFHRTPEHLANSKINTVVRADDNFIVPPNVSTKGLSRSHLLALHAVNQAITTSRVKLTSNVAVVVCSNSSEREGMEEIFPTLIEGKRTSPSRILNNQADSIATLISAIYKFAGPTIAVQAACVGGMVAIDTAMRYVFDYDFVIVVGADASTNLLSVNALTALGATSNRSMPFDDNRNGIVMGDGGGCLILQSNDKAARFRSTRYAKLYKPGSYTEHFNPTSPDPRGKGAVEAMSQAIAHIPELPNVISAHATSTSVGDISEYTAISKMFNSRVPVYAPKSKIGHTHGAASIVETIYAIESMKRQTLPHIANLNICSFDTNNILLRQNKSVTNVTYFRTLNNAFGFGGRCMSQVIEVSPFI